MTIFQGIAVPVFAALAVASITAVARGRIGRKLGTLWTLLSVGATVAIAWPDLTMGVARVLGIGRGADLVFYCAIVGAAFGFFAIFVRLRALDEHITTLVREMAVRAPERPSAPLQREGEVVPRPDVGRID